MRILLVFLIVPFFTFGATYYVDTAGSNSNSGNTANPWKTISYAVDQLIAGDTLNVNSGIYNEQVSVSVSGTIGNEIVIIGDSNSLPIIDGTSLTPVSRQGLIDIKNKSYLHIENLEIRSFTSNSNNTPCGILIAGESNNITIKNCKIHDIIQQKNSDGAHGIAVFGTSSSLAIHDIVLDGNEVYDCQLKWSEAFVLNGNVRDFVVKNNSVHDCDNIAFDFIGYEGECSGCTGDSGLNVDRARDGIVSNNIAFNIDTKDNTNYSPERSAAGFYVDGGDNIVFEGNMAHDCNIGFELASEHFGKSTSNIVIRNCIAYKNHISGVATGGYDSGNGAGGGSAEDCFVVNNTFYQNHNSSRSQDDWGAEILLQNRNVNNVYKNNIVVANSGDPRVSIAGSQNVNYSFGNNLYYGSTAGTSEGMTVNFDPEFTDASTFDFTLKGTSPAIDQGEKLGTSINGNIDFGGNNRLSGSSCDIGAFEYGLSVSIDHEEVMLDFEILYDSSRHTIVINPVEYFEEYEVVMLDFQGRRMSGDFYYSQTEISTTSYAKGVYFITINYGGKQNTTKMVID